MEKQIFVTILIAVFVIGGSLADDFNPPGWRGGPLSVEAEWDFEAQTPAAGIPPDGKYNTVGGSGGETLDPYFTHIDGTGTWVADPDGPGPKGGGFAFTGFVIHVANWIDQEPTKFIRLQFTGYMANGGISQFLTIPQFDVSASPLNDWTILDGDWEYNPDTDITKAWVDLQLWPNPRNEDIWFNTVPPGVIIDQVYVDTISIPEPCGMALLGAGVILARRRRR